MNGDGIDLDPSTDKSHIAAFGDSEAVSPITIGFHHHIGRGGTTEPESKDNTRSLRGLNATVAVVVSLDHRSVEKEGARASSHQKTRVGVVVANNGAGKDGRGVAIQPDALTSSVVYNRIVLRRDVLQPHRRSQAAQDAALAVHHREPFDGDVLSALDVNHRRCGAAAIDGRGALAVEGEAILGDRDRFMAGPGNLNRISGIGLVHGRTNGLRVIAVHGNDGSRAYQGGRIAVDLVDEGIELVRSQHRIGEKVRYLGP